MNREKLNEVKEELSPDFDEYFASPDFDPELLLFWIDYFEKNGLSESANSQENEPAGQKSNLAKIAALSYALFKIED